MKASLHSRREWLALAVAERTEWRKVLARSTWSHRAKKRAGELARKHKARMTVTEVDGVWVVFRARNRA